MPEQPESNDTSDFPAFFSKSYRPRSVIGGNRSSWEVVIPRSRTVVAGEVIEVDRKDGGVRWIRLTVEHPYSTAALTAVKQRWSFDNVADDELNEVLAGRAETAEQTSRAGRHAVVRDPVAAAQATPRAVSAHEPAHAVKAATDGDAQAAQDAEYLDELTVLAQDYFDDEPDAADVDRRMIIDVDLPVHDIVAPATAAPSGSIELVTQTPAAVAHEQLRVVELEEESGPSLARLGGYAVVVVGGYWVLRTRSRRRRARR